MEELKSPQRNNDLKIASSRPQAGLDRLNKRIEATPPNWRGMFQNASTGRASPRDAIAAKCRDCVGYEDTVNQVGGCTSYTCPIWAYRPYAK